MSSNVNETNTGCDCDGDGYNDIKMLPAEALFTIGIICGMVMVCFLILIYWCTMNSISNRAEKNKSKGNPHNKLVVSSSPGNSEPNIVHDMNTLPSQKLRPVKLTNVRDPGLPPAAFDMNLFDDRALKHLDKRKTPIAPNPVEPDNITSPKSVELPPTTLVQPSKPVPQPTPQTNQEQPTKQSPAAQEKPIIASPPQVVQEKPIQAQNTQVVQEKPRPVTSLSPQPKPTPSPGHTPTKIPQPKPTTVPIQTQTKIQQPKTIHHQPTPKAHPTKAHHGAKPTSPTTNTKPSSPKADKKLTSPDTKQKQDDKKKDLMKINQPKPDQRPDIPTLHPTD